VRDILSSILIVLGNILVLSNGSHRSHSVTFNELPTLISNPSFIIYIAAAYTIALLLFLLRRRALSLPPSPPSPPSFSRAFCPDCPSGAIASAGLGFGAWGLWFVVCGSGFGVWGLGLELGFVVCGLWLCSFASLQCAALWLEATGLRFVVCGFWFVVFGLWFWICGLWFVVCGLWFVVCGLWFVVCGLWFVVLGLWFWICGLWFVVCGFGFWFWICGLWFVLISMSSVLLGKTAVGLLQNAMLPHPQVTCDV